jgi:hypothetical protein
MPFVAEALYLHANDRDGSDTQTLATVHPDWHLGHERTGDLLLVAAPGHLLVDGADDEPRLQGSHGTAAETRVPLVVIRGDGRPVNRPCRDVSTADVGRTLLTCLGLRDVERLDARPIADDGRGRVLPGLCP